MGQEEKDKHEKAKADRKKAKKKYEQEEERELTNEEMEKIEKAKKNNDIKMAADLFGSDINNSILDIKLEDELDYINFAKIIHTKLQGAKTKKFIVEFLGVLFKDLETTFGSKEYSDVQGKVNVLLNTALQNEKGKDKKNKKKKGPVIQQGTQRENKAMYEGFGMEEAPENNAPGNNYEDDDDFM